MINANPRKNFLIIGLSAGLISSSYFFLEGISSKNQALALPGNIEFQWEQDPDYRKLSYYQSSNEKLARATYYLFLKPKQRKTGILKLTIKVPDYFKADLRPNKISLCKVKIGGYTDRTRCIEKLSSVIEVNKSQTAIDIYPDQPIPLNKKNYAVVMKIINPRSNGMFQFHALSQSPGDLPISNYLGTWNIDVQ